MSRPRILPTLVALALPWSWSSPSQAAPTEPGGLTNPLVAASTCTNCHSFGNIAPHEADPLYAPVLGWRGSMMGNAARDPVFWAGVAIASQDEPGGTIDCVRCHAPRAFVEGRGTAIAIDELPPDDLAGVECEACHRAVEDLDVPPGNARYTLDDVAVDGMVPRRGPWDYPDGIGDPPHEWIQDPYTGTSRLCGTCHDVTTPRERVDDDGVGMGFDFNEQRTYSEWSNSALALAGDDFRSCQDCHMPAVTDMPGCAENANAGNTHPTGGRRHDLAGANRFMLEVLRGLYGTDGSGQVDDFYYNTAIDNVDAVLATAATMEIAAPTEIDLAAGLGDLAVTVTNETGHRLPTGYSEGRVMWIEVIARYGEQVVWSSGTWTQGTGFEQDAQLRTYRAVAEDFADNTVNHLLRNNHWVEDTRIPPRGLVADVQTDPVGDRYTLLPDDTWPNFDVVAYAFPASPDIVDATPEVTDDDQLQLDVRLLYLINTPEYVQFLADDNVTNQAGNDVLTIFEDAGGATPVVLASQSLMIPIVGFGGVSDTSGTTASADTSGSDSTLSGSAGDSSTTAPVGGEDSSSSGPGATEGGGSDGCACSGTPPGTSPWWFALVLPLTRRRRRR
jgi:MYXO-CTERM domain-containing protein